MVVDVLSSMVVDVLDPTDVEVEPESSDVDVLSPMVLPVESSVVVDDESAAIEVETSEEDVVDVPASLDAHATPTTTSPAATAVTIPSIFLSISGTSFGTSPISEIPAQARFSSPSRFPQARSKDRKRNLSHQSEAMGGVPATAYLSHQSEAMGGVPAT
jgi:hypothetical protein